MNRKRIGVFLLSMMLIALLIISGCSVPKPAESKVPETPSATPAEKAEEKESSDVKAQDDFFEHVNAKLIKEKKAEREGQGWDQFADLSDKVKEQIKAIGEEVAKDTAKHDENSAEKAISDLYASAQDKESREKAGLGSLKTYLDELNAADSISSYLEVLAKIQRDLGKGSFLPFSLTSDPKDATKYAINLEEPMMLVDKMDLEDEATIEDIKTYAKELLVLSGTEEKEAASWSEKIVDLHKAIAKEAYSKKERANVKLTINQTSVEELQAKLPNMDVAKYMQDSGQSAFTSLVQQNPKMLSVMNSLLIEDNLGALKKYTAVMLLNDYAQYLNENFAKAYAKFNQMEEADAKEQAWDATQSLAEKEVGEIYAKKYFSPEKKEAITKLAKEILEAYKKNLQKLDWLSKESREEAIKKIDSMMVKVGYPDQYTSFVKGVVKAPKDGGTLIDNALLISQAQAENYRSKATEQVDKTEWGLSPQTINAFYEPTLNEICFPAAMLQAPFFDIKASRAQNLGGIGAVIAHEITHAFDDMGSMFDDKGNFRDWWTKEDRAAFEQRAQKYIKYFGSIEVLPGEKVDGELTLGENIADSGGVSVISSMFEDDMDGLREMFKSYANVWASISNEEELKAQLQGDEHAPAKVRVNGVLSITDAFYKAFDIKPGDKMYVKPEDRVKMF